MKQKLIYFLRKFTSSLFPAFCLHIDFSYRDFLEIKSSDGQLFLKSGKILIVVTD